MGKQRNWVPKPVPKAVTQPVPKPLSKPELTATATTAAIGAETTLELEPADLARRFGALVVDWILCVLISGLFASPHRAPWLPGVILIVEYAFFIGLFGRTPGMYVTRIRCVSVNDGGRIGIIPAAIRGFLLAILVPALIMDGRRRGWHDKAAGSMMVPASPRQS